MWRDDSVEFQNRMNLLVKNGLLGLALVLGALALFLDLRLAFWVSAGIAVSFVGAFAVMPWVGLSINMMSLFGFILAIGIVVDDAIVTGENIYAENERGTPEVEAAVRGAQRVTLPVALAVLTTIAAFVPLLFAPGTIGKFLFQIPAVVIIVLLVSVIEAMFILPHHLAHLHIAGFTPRTRIGALLADLRHATDRALRRFVNGPLDRALRFVTTHYVVAMAAGVAVLIVTLRRHLGGLRALRVFSAGRGPLCDRLAGADAGCDGRNDARRGANDRTRRLRGSAHAAGCERTRPGQRGVPLGRAAGGRRPGRDRRAQSAAGQQGVGGVRAARPRGAHGDLEAIRAALAQGRRRAARRQEADLRLERDQSRFARSGPAFGALERRARAGSADPAG